MEATNSKKIGKRAVFLAVFGLFFCFMSYKMYENYEKQVFVQQHSPLVRVPISGRVKGLGTLKSPNKILILHNGKQYALLTGNPYFRKTVKDESIEVNFDPVRDVAVLPGSRPRGSYPLLGVIFLLGLFFMGYAIYDFRSISALQKK